MVDEVNSYQGLKTVESLSKYICSTDCRPHLKVYWLYGAPGTGKTRCAFEFAKSTGSYWMNSVSL